MITRFLLATIALLPLLVALPGRTDEKAPAPALDFLVNTSVRPVHVRLHLEVDGQPLEQAFRTAHREQLRAQFVYLDRNGDGALDEGEARGIPLPLFRLPDSPSSEDVHLAFNFRALDLDGDGKVTLVELAGFYEEFEGGPFEVRVSPPSPSVGGGFDLALFNKLDTDSNGKLSAKEIAASGDLLAKLNTEGDELITLANVAPQFFPQQGLAPGEVPLVPVQATRSPVSVDPRQLEAFRGLQPDIELRVRLGERKPDAPALEVLRPRGKGPLTAQFSEKDGQFLLKLEKVRVEFRLDGTRLSLRSLAALQEQALRNFRSADANGDGTVDRAEAKRSVFLRELHGILDRKGTGSVAEAQMREYCDKVLALQARTMARRVSLVVAQGTLGMWDLLDTNRDGMLGLREMRNAPAVIASLDANHDGFVEHLEVPTLFLTQLGVGQTDYRRLSGDEVVKFSPDGRLGYSSGAEGGGPVWFRKMDRNGDGDVSRREFLGPPEAFRKVDRDGDGLISREEAERVDTSRPARP